MGFLPVLGAHWLIHVTVIFMTAPSVFCFLPLILSWVHGGAFQRPTDTWHCSRLNPEADMIIQMFLVKPDVCDLKTCSKMISFSQNFLGKIYFFTAINIYVNRIVIKEYIINLKCSVLIYKLNETPLRFSGMCLVPSGSLGCLKAFLYIVVGDAKKGQNVNEIKLCNKIWFSFPSFHQGTSTSGLTFDVLESSEACCLSSLKEAGVIEEEQGPSVLEGSVPQRMFCTHWRK